MSLRNYTMNKVLARLSAQDREEMLQRQRAQNDAANRVGTMQMIERLTGIAGQLPGAIADESARGFGEAAAAAGPGEKILDEDESLNEQILDGSQGPGPAADSVPQIDFVTADEPIIGQSKMPPKRAAPYGVSVNESDFSSQIAGMPAYRSTTRHDLDMTPAAIPAGATGPASTVTPKPVSPIARLTAEPAAPAKNYADLGFNKRPKETHDAFLARVRQGVADKIITPWDAAQIVGKMPSQPDYAPTAPDAVYTTMPSAQIGKTLAPTVTAPKAAAPAPVKPAVQKARIPGESETEYGNRLNQLQIAGDIDQHEYADLWKRKDEKPMPIPDAMAGGPQPAPVARPAATPYRAPPGKGPTGPGASLQGTELEDNLAELDRKFKAKEISEEEYLKAVKANKGEVMQAFSQQDAMPAAVKQEAADEKVDPVTEGTKKEAAAQTAVARKYSPIKWKRTPEEEAAVQLEEIIRLKQPHPLLNILSLGMAQNKFDVAKSVALKQAAKVIRSERRVLENDNLNVFKAERVGTAGKTPEQIAAEIKFKQAQADYMKKRAEAPLGRTAPIGANTVDTVVSQQAALDEIGETVSLARNLVKSNDGLPTTQAKDALIGALQAAGSDIDASSFGTSGFTVSMSNSAGGAYIDPEQVEAAFDRVEKSSQTPAQRKYVRKVKQLVQQIGKSKEGGKLTDADLAFYMGALLGTDSPEEIFDTLEDQHRQIKRDYGARFGFYADDKGEFRGQRKPSEFSIQKTSPGDLVSGATSWAEVNAANAKKYDPVLEATKGKVSLRQAAKIAAEMGFGRKSQIDDKSARAFASALGVATDVAKKLLKDGGFKGALDDFLGGSGKPTAPSPDNPAGNLP